MRPRTSNGSTAAPRADEGLGARQARSLAPPPVVAASWAFQYPTERTRFTAQSGPPGQFARRLLAEACDCCYRQGLGATMTKHAIEAARLRKADGLKPDSRWTSPWSGGSFGARSSSAELTWPEARDGLQENSPTIEQRAVAICDHGRCMTGLSGLRGDARKDARHATQPAGHLDLQVSDEVRPVREVWSSALRKLSAKR